MARFYYAAQDKQGTVVKGELEARERQDAIEALVKRGLTPIKLELMAGEEKSKAGRLKAPFTLSRRLGIFDQITIIRHLGTILNTGTDILNGLEIIAQDAIKPLVKKILFDIKDRIGRGESFSDSIKVWQDQFNPVFINLVKAAEQGGNLPATLLSYAQELRKDYTFIRKLKGAMVYPAILVSALSVMVIIVLSVVTPRLKELFISLKAEPPFYTKFFFIASDLMLNYTVYLIIGVAIFAVALTFTLRVKKFQRRLGALLWHLPILKKIQKNLVLMRFSRTLAQLLQAGFSLKAALAVTGEILNIRYQQALKDIQKRLEGGINFAEAIRAYPHLFPVILTSVIATGEKSGQLALVLNQMSEFYEEEVIYSLELILTLIEPVLLVVVGIIVGLLASSLISPIYRLIGSI